MTASSKVYGFLRILRFATAISKGRGGTWARRSVKSYGIAKLTSSWRHS